MSELIRKLKEKKFITKIKVKDDISDELLSKEITQRGSLKIVEEVKKEIGPVRPPYAVMRETNPELMDVCVKYNWAANQDYMTYEEAAMITDEMIKSYEEYVASQDYYITFSKFKDLTHFEEFQYFTGVEKIKESTFYNCSNLTNITIPDSVTVINDYVFRYCSSLTSVTIPNSVISIRDYVFDKCSNLTTITCLATTAPYAAFEAFGSLTDSYAGRNTYNQGINKLKVPTGATGYDTDRWLDPLCNAEKCGFTIEYI